MIYFGKHSLALARLNAGGLSPISHRSVFHQDVYDTPARNAMEALALRNAMLPTVTLIGLTLAGYASYFT